MSHPCLRPSGGDQRATERYEDEEITSGGGVASGCCPGGSQGFCWQNRKVPGDPGGGGDGPRVSSPWRVTSHHVTIFVPHSGPVSLLNAGLRALIC